jgi:hypothetical protein
VGSMPQMVPRLGLTAQFGVVVLPRQAAGRRPHEGSGIQRPRRELSLEVVRHGLGSTLTASAATPTTNLHDISLNGLERGRSPSSRHRCDPEVYWRSADGGCR